MAYTFHIFFIIPLLIIQGSSIHGQEFGQLLIGQGTVTSTLSHDPDDFNILRSLIRRACAQEDIAFSPSPQSHIVIHSSVHPLLENDLDVNGIPMKVYEIEYALSISDQLGETQFNEIRIILSESAESERKLLQRSQRKLNQHIDKVTTFLAEAKENFREYYERQCPVFMKEAQRFINQEQFEDAITRLGQIPKEVKCYEEASRKIISAYEKKLQKECTILLGEVKTLAEQRKFASAYEKAALIPRNSQCSNEMDAMLNYIANKACAAIIAHAEAFYANHQYEKAVMTLQGLDQISRECAIRKAQIEKDIQARIDEANRKAWAFKMKKYEDEQARLRQKAKTDHEFAMEKMETDATIRSKELDTSVELEKYRTHRMIHYYANDAAIKKARYDAAAKVYTAALKRPIFVEVKKGY